ncbi:MAG: hypothetical protein FGM15_01930 [Chthoniobacterales bacterium]|nr:hypothetical protein [Chthoniobacterales bacterium]
MTHTLGFAAEGRKPAPPWSSAALFDDSFIHECRAKPVCSARPVGWANASNFFSPDTRRGTYLPVGDRPMTEHRSSREDFLNLDEDTAAPGIEQIDDQVAQAQERLIALKRQAEQLEREKAKLEELSRRQEQFDNGRNEMVDKFTSSLVAIQRETDQTLKRLEILKNVQTSFTDYLHELEAINPKDWAPEELNKELSKALGAVEDARSVFVKAQAQIGADTETGGEASPFDTEGGGQGFGYWLMAGFAFTLPLCALVLLGLVLWFLQLAS